VSYVYRRLALEHYGRYWKVTPRLRTLDAGPTRDLPPWFAVAEFHTGDIWRYATVGMSAGAHGGVETYLISPDQNDRAVEILFSLTRFHLTGKSVGLAHTVNFGMPLWGGSQLDHGYLSYPYLENEGFLYIDRGGARSTGILWLIPITREEREFKRQRGANALESLFEEHQLDCADPFRRSVLPPPPPILGFSA